MLHSYKIFKYKQNKYYINNEHHVSFSEYTAHVSIIKWQIVNFNKSFINFLNPQHDQIVSVLCNIVAFSKNKF